MITVAVPCYNEGKVLESSYKEIKRVLEEIRKEIGEDYEIIFEEEGSTDNTAELMHSFAKKDRHVKVLSFPEKRMGLGWGWRQLFAAAKGDYIIMVDADMSVPADIFKDFMREIKNWDIVVASRYIGSKTEMPYYRKFASRVYYLFNRFLFGIPVKDSQSGFQIYRRKVIDTIKLESKGFEINLELLMKASVKGFRTKEIPAEYHHREKEAKFSVLKNGPGVLIDTFWLWKKIKEYQ